MTFVKTNQTELRAVSSSSINQEEYAQKAKHFLQQAQHVGARTSGRKARHDDNQLLLSYPAASELQTKHEIELTLQAAEHFRIAGEHYWFDSSKSYALAAALYSEDLKDPSRAAELFTEAGIISEKVDSDFANEYYRKAITHHCDASDYNKAAMLEERMAKNHCKKNDYDASIEEYTRASKLYTAANMHDSADRTLDCTAYLLGKAGRVRDSAYAYQSNAISQAKQNLKKFNVPSIMLRAGVLLLADRLQQSPDPDFSEIRQMMEEIYSLDCRFEEPREHLFLADMMQCVVHGDVDKFADCLYSFNKITEFDDLMLDALEVVKKVIAERAEKSR